MAQKEGREDLHVENAVAFTPGVDGALPGIAARVIGSHAMKISFVTMALLAESQSQPALQRGSGQSSSGSHHLRKHGQESHYPHSKMTGKRNAGGNNDKHPRPAQLLSAQQAAHLEAALLFARFELAAM